MDDLKTILFESTREVYEKSQVEKNQKYINYACAYMDLLFKANLDKEFLEWIKKQRETEVKQ